MAWHMADEHGGGRRPRLDIFSAAWPPKTDGIGDHSYRLAHGLADRASIRVWTHAQDRLDRIPGVTVEGALDASRRWSVMGVADRVLADRPDAVLVQFNQFSWGKRGFNPWLPAAVAKLAREGVRVGVMFHEMVVPATTARFRAMRLWQVRQYRSLARSATVRFYSIQPWADEQRGLARSAAVHLPVGSNLPGASVTREASRARHGFGEDEVVLGVFGTAHPSRLVGHVAEAVGVLRAAGRSVAVLYVGPDGEAIGSSLGSAGARIVSPGRLPGQEAADALRGVDVFVSPFIDGVSTRRGSMMAALRVGLPVVGTHAENTDRLLLEANGRSICLTPMRDKGAFASAVARLATDREAARAMGESGAAMYRARFDWPVAADRVARELGLGAGAPGPGAGERDGGGRRSVARELVFGGAEGGVR